VADEDQFFESMQEIFRGTNQEELNGIFQVWVRRVQEISQGNGDYVRRQISFIGIGYVQFHQTGLAHVLIDQTIVIVARGLRALSSELRHVREGRTWSSTTKSKKVRRERRECFNSSSCASPTDRNFSLAQFDFRQKTWVMS
jgi:hypothetical protein